LRRFLAAAALCALLPGCSKVGAGGDPGSGGGSRHPWTKPGILRIGFQTSPNTLNPILQGNTSESAITRLMFDGLVSVDASGKRDVPILASVVPTVENGGISRDGLTLTYHLRSGVKWHDGVPFSSKDVAFTWRAIMSPNNDVLSQSGYSLVNSVDTPNATTVVFHMKQRFSPAINTLFAESDTPYEILPEHLLGKLHDINSIPFNSNPIGTGPFKFKDWVRGDHITLVPNDDYFLGKPKLHEIELKFVPDENTEVNLLRTHDIDWQFEASEQLYRALKSVPDLKIVLQNMNEYERVHLNTASPVLSDVRVRQAIAYAIDKRKLVEALTFGSATVADQDLPPFMWAHAEDVTRYEHDLPKARALLRAAGWIPGPDGDVVKNGNKMVLSIVYNQSNATRRAAVVQVQAMLKAIGIEVEIKGYQGALLFAPVGQGGILQNGKYDLAWTAWIAGIDPDQSSLFTCARRPPHGNNDYRYCNPELDAAEQRALTNYDIPTRKKAYAEIEAILTRDVPVLPIWWPHQIQPINPDFTTFSPNPVTETWNAYTWDI